jgi:hypothetical protein
MALTQIHNRRVDRNAAPDCTNEEAKEWAASLVARGVRIPGVVSMPAPGVRGPVKRPRTVNNGSPMVRAAVAQQRGGFTVRHVHLLCPDITESAVCNHLAAWARSRT